MGQEAKTDPLDARLLARYGEKREPEPERGQVKELMARRQQLVAERVRERNRLEREKSSRIEDSLFRPRDWLDREIEQLAQLAKLYRSVRGAGLQTAATLIAGLPELGRWDGKALTALAGLAGLAPWPEDSGKQQGYRAIRGGRAVARRALYPATLTALRGDNDLRRFYRGLRERGKAGKVAMAAASSANLSRRSGSGRRSSASGGRAAVRALSPWQWILSGFFR